MAKYLQKPIAYQLQKRGDKDSQSKMARRSLRDFRAIKEVIGDSLFGTEKERDEVARKYPVYSAVVRAAIKKAIETGDPSPVEKLLDRHMGRVANFIHTESGRLLSTDMEVSEKPPVTQEEVLDMLRRDRFLKLDFGENGVIEVEPIKEKSDD